MLSDILLDEIKAFFTEKSKADGEVSEEAVEQIAGGKVGKGDLDLSSKINFYSVL